MVRYKKLLFILVAFFCLEEVCAQGILPDWMRRKDRAQEAPSADGLIKNNSSENLPNDGKCHGSKVELWTDCFGTVRQNNGTYEGYFKNGKYHGPGTFISSTGAFYKGEYSQGIPSGRGKMKLDNGNEYEGELKDGSFNGQGVLFLSNGDKYTGSFKNGKTDGFGSYRFQNGDEYVGEQRENRRNGRGKYIFSSGKPPIEGIFENDKLVRIEKYDQLQVDKNSSSALTSSKTEFERKKNGAEQELLREEEVVKKIASNNNPIDLKISNTQPNSKGEVQIIISTDIDTASLTINDEELGGRSDGKYQVKKIARAGQETKFKITATSTSGNVASKSISVFRSIADSSVQYSALNPVKINARSSNDSIAIIIGIEKYKRIQKADYANEDALAFYDYAIRALGVKPENIKMLLDDQADDVEILATFQSWLPIKVQKQKSDVYIFYSGHGLPSEDGKNLYFLPYGTDKQYLDRTALNQQIIVNSIQASKPRSVTMFIDACYSGQSRTGENLIASARPIYLKQSASSFPPEFSVFSASAPDQLSSSSPELKHGVFSYYLMKGMEGDADENRDGKITLGEMHSYLAENVARQAGMINRKQDPQLFGDSNRVLVGR